MVSTLSSLTSSASYSIYSLNNATQQVSLSSARLSSGNRIVRAGDDVAALTQSVKLQTEISSLRQALQNTTQADSMLQVAYSGLSTISDILTDMKSLAVQSNSGSLTASERSFLQVEFSTLTSEIDRIASETSFNGIALLDGSISEENTVTTYDTAASSGSVVLTFTANLAGGEDININGVDITAGTEFAVGATIDDTISNISDYINNTATAAGLTSIRASAAPGALTLSSRSAGALSNYIIVNENLSSGAARFVVGGSTTAHASIFTASGGSNDGLFQSGVSATGTSGDALVAAQNLSGSTLRMNFTGLPANGNTFSIDDGNGGTVAFTMTTAAPATNVQIQIGATVTETIQNIIEGLGNYTGNARFTLDQLDITRDGDDVVFTNKQAGDTFDLTFTDANLAETLTNATLSGTTFNNGSTTGVNAEFVTNPDFIGTISGFSATYNSADNLTASITVGDATYTATITDTTPAANTSVRFRSNTTDGGYFDVTLATGGVSVNAQADANIYAARLDAAFSGLTFNQNRVATSFTGTGNLAAAQFEFSRDDFSNVSLSDISVTAPASSSGSAIIEFTINGETFRSNSNLGSSIGAREVIRFQSTSTTNQVTLRMGTGSMDLSTTAAASAAEDLFESSFGIGENGSGTISFQLGSSSANTLAISIGSASTSRLFSGESIDVSTASNAANASTVLDDAIDRIGELMAQVGSHQAVANYASSDITNQITYKSEAHSALVDTDIASEATRMAVATVQARSAISVLAQTQNLMSAMLGLMEVGA